MELKEKNKMLNQEEILNEKKILSDEDLKEVAGGWEDDEECNCRKYAPFTYIRVPNVCIKKCNGGRPAPTTN